MKKLFLVLLSVVTTAGACAQRSTTIKLNAPDKHRGEPTMQAFDKRKSTREFSDRKLSIQDLSDLLWAANGYNRPGEKPMRTSPTAMNKQEIDIYVCMPDGAYIYDVKLHELTLVTHENVIPHLVATQEWVQAAPLCLVIVADLERAGGDNDNTRMWTAYDAGIVSQNISLFCSGCGLATVPRGYVDKDGLSAALGLKPSQLIHLNHPVGYFK